jgi:hypothetical protein
MGTLVGILLIGIAAATVVTVLVVVMREPHVHEEYYIPTPKPPTSETRAPSATGPGSVNELVTETLGLEIQATPVSEPPAEENPDMTA